METLDAIKTRKSVRRFQDRPVEREKMNALLEAAVQAPSWTNKQCWRFIVVTEKETIEKLTKANSNFNSWLKDAPVVIVACADPKDSGESNGMQYFMMDVSLAMHNLVLAATDMGLGTCYIGAFDEKRTREILEIPENIRVVAMTPLGYSLDKKTLGDKITGAIFRSSIRRDRK
ncbi:MAG: nitroreductase family protein, partial [Methanomassiliicoccales archaeon]|nr:nitroreductase family protein [Methanomassiliicoccales archaeon]